MSGVLLKRPNVAFGSSHILFQIWRSSGENIFPLAFYPLVGTLPPLGGSPEIRLLLPTSLQVLRLRRAIMLLWSPTPPFPVLRLHAALVVAATSNLLIVWGNGTLIMLLLLRLITLITFLPGT